MNFTPIIEKKKEKKDEGMQFDPVTRYMAVDLITFKPKQSVEQVIDILVKNKITGGPVLNEKGELIGIISDRDCLKVIMDKAINNQPVRDAKVENYMTTNVQTISVDCDVIDVANEFLNSKFRRFPVVDGKGKLVGQVSRVDILKAAKNLEITTW